MPSYFFPIFESGVKEYAIWIIAIAVCIMILYALVNHRPVRPLIRKLKNTNCTISILVGDLFEQSERGFKKVIAIGTDERFSVASSGPSLIRQLCERCFGGDVKRLEKQIDIKDAQPPSVKKIEAHYGRKNLPLDVFLVAVKPPSLQSTIREIRSGLDALWVEVRKDDCDSIVVPLVGTKGGGESKGKIVVEIIESFVASLKEGVVVERLTIVIHPDDFYSSNDDLDFEKLRHSLEHICKYPKLNSDDVKPNANSDEMIEENVAVGIGLVPTGEPSETAMKLLQDIAGGPRRQLTQFQTKIGRRYVSDGKLLTPLMDADAENELAQTLRELCDLGLLTPTLPTKDDAEKVVYTISDLGAFVVGAKPRYQMP